MPLNWENRSSATTTTVSWLQCVGCGDWFTARVRRGQRPLQYLYNDQPSPDRYHPECWTQFLQDQETRRLMQSMDDTVNGDDDFWNYLASL